jgi:hypothetical protein
MTILFAALENSLLVIESSNYGWKIQEHLKGFHPTSVAVDPQNSSRAYCGTWNNGLWKTDDNGQTWNQIKTNVIPSDANIMSLSTSFIEREEKGYNYIFVGTEPSGLYASSDGGESWQVKNNFMNLKSSSSWSFPPRPWTNHVRWIESDKNNEGFLFVAIEAGALIQSHDYGETWIDRVNNGPYDTHTLLTHKMAPKRLYSAAGDGYFESFDYGQSWNRPSKGIDHRYLVGMAVNSADPQNVIISSASEAWKAHSRDENSESFLYMRSKDGEKWNLVTGGLPDSKGTIISMLAANPKIKGEFYCLNNRGIFCSTDSGVSWTRLNILWPKDYNLQHPWALAVKK